MRHLKGKRILVTGGAGFIGSNLCEYFLWNDNEVICLDNFSTGYKENIEPFFKSKKFTLIEGDIRNTEDCEKACKGVEYVFHHAALGSVPRSINDPVTSTDVNIGGFVKILMAAVNAKVKRFIFAASSSTYGDHEALPKVEEVIGNPLSPYAITKYVDELFAENFSKIYGIETIGFRYFNVFGKRQDPSGAYAAVIPKFILQILNNESPSINGDGSFSRDFTYIRNVVKVNELAALASRKSILLKVGKKQNYLSEVFNVAHGERTSLNDLFKYLVENLSQYREDIKGIKPIYKSKREGDIPHSLASIEKAKKALEYYPEYNMKTGLKEVCEWYYDKNK
ncbi:SDR family oxidoreductase [Saccharicrinis sp. FJH54]|uniref:SDR family oxidoreductase n=1 Tax=Saccharicrinis sp. FJH54 TaxID=3344665 RepID=UPI0035D45167